MLNQGSYTEPLLLSSTLNTPTKVRATTSHFRGDSPNRFLKYRRSCRSLTPQSFASCVTSNRACVANFSQSSMQSNRLAIQIPSTADAVIIRGQLSNLSKHRLSSSTELLIRGAAAFSCSAFARLLTPFFTCFRCTEAYLPPCLNAACADVQLG
jgi:hypothetical protein